MPESTAAHRIKDIEVLCTIAREHAQPSLAYSGEVMPEQAWNYILHHDDGVLVDVRTQPEWQFTGEPDLSRAAGKLAKISWKHYPAFTLNPDFMAMLKEQAPAVDAPLFFLCRSGGRSLDAAMEASAQGYRYCFNVTNGFEGDPDAYGHRGKTAGWKAAGLPWKQG